MTAPAAEVPRKPRRVGDDDFADMTILRGLVVVRSQDARHDPVIQSYLRLRHLNVGMTLSGRGFSPRHLAEREREGLHAGIEKLDLEQPIGDRLGLPDQLIQALLGDRAVALVVDIDAVSRTWRAARRSAREIAQRLPGAAGPMTRCRSRA